MDWVIPGNDDALRAIRLFTSKISDAVVVGHQSFEQTQIADQKSAEGAGEDGVDYVDTSAYEVYEKQEGDFVEGEPAEAIAGRSIAAADRGRNSASVEITSTDRRESCPVLHAGNSGFRYLVVRAGVAPSSWTRNS